MRQVALVVLSLLLGATSARADLDDRFAPFYFDPNEPSSAALVGEIDSRTPLAFSRLVETLPSIKTLFLSSPGGNVYSAILIAREVDRLGLSTIIPKDADCFSACSFIYFAGHERFTDGRLGVHQVSSQDPDLVAAQLAVSDISELLSEFGVPNDLFLLMLRTPPEEMHVLDQSELNRFGLVGSRLPNAVETGGVSDDLNEGSQEVPNQSTDFSLTDGTYSSGGLTVVIEQGLVGVTYTGQGCIGAFDGEMREEAGSISFIGQGCSISVTKLGPFDFNMDQGPGCSDYHGAACGLSGYVRRSN
jgi:hypothetical protein